MAQKKVITYVCDRCDGEREKPYTTQVKINMQARKWETFDLCPSCRIDFSNFMANEGFVEDEDDNDEELEA